MKIKKNGKTINLTEGDIKILSKAILKEQDQMQWEDRWQQERGRVDPSDYEKLKIELTKSLKYDEIVVTIPGGNVPKRAYVSFSPHHLPTRNENITLEIPINDLPEILPSSN